MTLWIGDVYISVNKRGFSFNISSIRKDSVDTKKAEEYNVTIKSYDLKVTWLCNRLLKE